MKTMAEVLFEADAKWCDEVGCATSAEWAQTMAAALAAAGYGPAKEAQSRALRDAADSADGLGLTLIPSASLRARAAAIEEGQ